MLTDNYEKKILGQTNKQIKNSFKENLVDTQENTNLKTIYEEKFNKKELEISNQNQKIKEHIIKEMKLNGFFLYFYIIII